VAIFRVVRARIAVAVIHCAIYIVFTLLENNPPDVHSMHIPPQNHEPDNILTFNILFSSLFYHLTGILTKL
jgi:hypothetical protein